MSFLLAYRNNHLDHMRTHAPCATTLAHVVDTSFTVPGTSSERFALPIVQHILAAHNQLELPQPTQEDLALLRALHKHGIVFGLKCLTAAIKAKYVPAVRLFVHEAQVWPTERHAWGWQPFHTVFEVHRHLGILAKGVLRRAHSTTGFHEPLQFDYLLAESPTLRRLWLQPQTTVDMPDLLACLAEINGAMLDILLSTKEFVHGMLMWHPRHPMMTHTHRTILHAAALAADHKALARLGQLISSTHQMDLWNKTDAFGMTCLDLAWTSKSIQVIKHLSGFGSVMHTSASVNASDDSACDIDVVEEMDEDTFWREYVLQRRPVLIKRGATRWPAFKRWKNVEYLKQQLGTFHYEFTTIPYPSLFGVQQSNATPAVALSDFLSSVFQKKGMKEIEINFNPLNGDETMPLSHESITPLYLFSPQPLLDATVLRSDFPKLPQFARPSPRLQQLLRLHLNDAQLYIGGVGSGSPVHFHAASLNANFMGVKRYVLLPPEKSVYSTVPVAKWSRSNLQRPILKCVQMPGDILFIPSLWGHGVENLEATCGIAQEFMINVH